MTRPQKVGRIVSFLRAKKVLPPLPPGFGDFWVTAHVKLATPIPDAEDPAALPLQGYYRNFGIRAPLDRVPVVLQAAISDGAIDWNDTEWEPVDAEKLDRVIRKRVEPLQDEGIWYAGGRVFYADPDLEPLPT